jgi:hypothetical protein
MKSPYTCCDWQVTRLKTDLVFHQVDNDEGGQVGILSH